jgi:hypothetical protein
MKKLGIFSWDVMKNGGDISEKKITIYCTGCSNDDVFGFLRKHCNDNSEGNG